MASKADIRDLQRAMNKFTRERLAGIEPLVVDGDFGISTKRRVRMCKYYLGYNKKRRRGREAFLAGREFRWRLRYPRRVGKHQSPFTVALSAKRRINQRKKYKKNHEKAGPAAGVGWFDGKPCPLWLIPYLKWARNNGWNGRLVSGWRDPVYSEHLCRVMCGAPSCPGRCAGRASNHSGSLKPRGAIDVSMYIQFAQVIRRCPYSPRIFNNLPNDRVHFSATGN